MSTPVLLRGDIHRRHKVGDVVGLAGGADVEDQGEAQKQQVGPVLEQLPQVHAAALLFHRFGAGAGLPGEEGESKGMSMSTPQSQKVFSTPTKGSREEMIRLPTVNRMDPRLRSRP